MGQTGADHEADPGHSSEVYASSVLRLEQVDAFGVESPVLIRLPGWQLGLEAVPVGQLFPVFFLQGTVSHVHHPRLPALLDLADEVYLPNGGGRLDLLMDRSDAAVHELVA